ncbi:MAG: prenyltransferase/squalene oxidase repeat-containing protein [Planctomycetota bacterium]
MFSPQPPTLPVPGSDADRFAGCDSADSRDHAEAALIASLRRNDGRYADPLPPSPSATAAALTALSIAEQHSACQLNAEQDEAEVDDRWTTAYQTDLCELMCQSARWLAHEQNADGGWGHLLGAESQPAATLAVLSALRLTGVPAQYADLEPSAEHYLRKHQGVAHLRKQERHADFGVSPALIGAAAAGVIPWRQVQLPLAPLASLPTAWLKRSGLRALGMWLPIIQAAHLAKRQRASRIGSSPQAAVGWLERRDTLRPALKSIERCQPDSGGFREETTATSLVVMSLASIGLAQHSIVRRGVEFLMCGVRGDGCWSAGADPDVLSTAECLIELLSLRQERAEFRDESLPTSDELDQSVAWLLACQHKAANPFSWSKPGGWSATSQTGGQPDCLTTATVISALVASAASGIGSSPPTPALGSAVSWLLEEQNADGGWASGQRSPEWLTGVASGAVATARALSALSAVEPHAPALQNTTTRIRSAIERGSRWLTATRKGGDGWGPNAGDSPAAIAATAEVLNSLSELTRADSPMARSALQCLRRQRGDQPGLLTDSERIRHATSLRRRRLLRLATG